jgi:hypothetical protein
MPHTKRQTATELEAFCATCPAAKEVTALLATLGFRLEFQMDEQRDHSGQLPPLPAQYHYKDVAHGTEVIYLSGRDFPMNEDGYPLPLHASRFWLYAGTDPSAFQLVASKLAVTHQFSWRDPSEESAPAQEEVA